MAENNNATSNLTPETAAKLTEAEWHEIRIECAPPTDYDILRGIIESVMAERMAQVWENGYLACLDGASQQDDNPHTPVNTE